MLSFSSETSHFLSDHNGVRFYSILPRETAQDTAVIFFGKNFFVSNQDF